MTSTSFRNSTGNQDTFAAAKLDKLDSVELSAGMQEVALTKMNSSSGTMLNKEDTLAFGK